MNPEEIGDSRGGRGRGAGRGAGVGRGAGRGSPVIAGRVLPQVQPGRHSSYTPSDPTTAGTPPPRGGANFRPQSNYSESKTPLVQVDNETENPPTTSLRGMGLGGRGSGRGMQGSVPGNPAGPKNPLANTEPLPRRSLNFNQQPPTEQANGRALPKFSDVKTVVDDEPTPPPRSPHVSPRLSNLPPLPPRAGSDATSTAPTSSPASPTTPQATDAAEESKRADMRHKVLEEIYNTERDYIDDLEILINVFIFPLRTMKILEENTLYSIFSNVEVLIGCNAQMYKELGEGINGTENGESARIGAIFTRLADYFKMYKVYCANQQNALGSVELLMKKNSQFKKNLDVCHSDPRCRGLFLQSFLIKPIQRVCKYPLLLRELIRYTPETHMDYQPLKEAMAKVEQVVSEINEAKRQAEGLQRILDLQNMIEGVESLVSAGRYYVKEGELSFYKSPKSKKNEKRHVFFFTDLIVLTHRKGEKKFEHKLSVPLDACTLIVLADSSYIKNAFELSQKQLSKKCILSGESAEESNQWIKEIRALIKGYQKRKLREIEDMKKKGLTPVSS